MTRLLGTAYRSAATVAVLLLCASPDAESQTIGTLSREENFRRAPNGEILARLEPGAKVTIVGSEGNWLHVDLTGWVWMRSLQVNTTGSFDLVVAASDGENLRDAPQGSVLARLGRGTLLDEMGREPGWLQVTRRGYLWSGSVTRSEPPPNAGRGSTAAGTGAEPAGAGAAAGGRGAAPTGGAPSSRPAGFVRSGTRGTPVLNAPDGDTLARAMPNAEMEVLGREGSWVRVRVEGWAWMPDVPDTVSQGGAPLDPADLAANPKGLRGRIVSWRLQFVSLERAEAVRTAFFEGEPFLLARFGGDTGPFVYVAVPPERLAEVEGLVPLERISVTARVRTGASVLTGTPIVDLMRLVRERRQ